MSTYLGNTLIAGAVPDAATKTELNNGLATKANTDLSNIEPLLALTKVLSAIQNTDSTKVGYVYSTNGLNVDVTLPAGGKYLILMTFAGNNSSGAVYSFASDITVGGVVYQYGSIVDGGTKIRNARSGHTSKVLAIRVA